jgi:imidazolonepropionase-like amidohydrolase
MQSPLYPLLRKALGMGASSLGTTICALLCLSSTPAQAQITVLRHITVIDGNGGKPRHDAALVIDGQRIRAVTDANAPTPAGATVLDLNGKTIMPEIVNAHGHLGLLKGTTAVSANYSEASVERQLLQYQDYGVGAVQVMGTDHPEIWQWRAESRAGTRPGALIYTAGGGFGVVGGLLPVTPGIDPLFRPTTPEEARKDVRDLAVHKPDLIKIWVDDFWGQYPKMKPEIYAAIIDEAHKQHLRVAAHVYHESDAQQLADDGIDIFAHSVRDAEIPDSLVAEMKRKHIAYITTMSLDDFLIAYADDPSWLNQSFFRDALEPGVYEMITSQKYKDSVKADKKTPIETAALPIAMKNFKKLYDAGILVALGTDSGATSTRPIGFSEHREMQLMVQAGLTPLQVITIATKNGAELLRASNEFGTLRPGLRANFIVLDKDPSTDIRNTETISAVWKNGKKVSDGPHPRSE